MAICGAVQALLDKVRTAHCAACMRACARLTRGYSYCRHGPLLCMLTSCTLQLLPMTGQGRATAIQSTTRPGSSDAHREFGAQPHAPRRMHVCMQTGMSPRDIDILITTCSIYCPTPSMASMVRHTHTSCIPRCTALPAVSALQPHLLTACSSAHLAATRAYTGAPQQRAALRGSNPAPHAPPHTHTPCVCHTNRHCRMAVHACVHAGGQRVRHAQRHRVLPFGWHGLLQWGRGHQPRVGPAQGAGCMSTGTHTRHV